MSKGSFSLDLSKFAELTNGKLNTVTKKAFIELTTEIIETSPVDEGRFRANWFPAIDGFSDEVTEDTDERRAKNRLAPMYNKLKTGQMLTLSNNLDYAMAIEYGEYGTKNAGSPDSKVTSSGYSKKAPSGVVRVNIGRWADYIDEQARKLK